MEAEFQTVSEIAQHSSARPKASGAEDLAFGSLAGMMGKCVEYPFDTVKVRLQTSETQVFSGTVDCLRQTWRNEGFRGFYRGLTSPLVGAMAENAIAFYAYNRIQGAIRSITAVPSDAALSLPQLFLSGGLSGTICAFVISPVELVKCKLQVENVQGYAGAANPGAVKFKGPLSVVAHLLKTQGIVGMYKGIAPTVARETLGVGFWFGAYELVCRQLVRASQSSSTPLHSKADLGPASIILAGGCAGIAYNLTSYPIDVVKSYIQTADVRSPASERPGIAGTIRIIYGRGGVPAFYRGLGITLLRAFPANAAMFMTYEYLTRLSAELRKK
ncbi:mitochondrial ornithine carrier protein [Coemansia thaxteri]|uniref:Mitochondrial ornithine carrier protein n=1 Tax=Coemansia thaxteri TaxID=2663907 RepID=A0A9W8BHI8_9FUNG|nr:mitochondrial ornithine carrier protein [Coemansia thaxteri]KAJ2008752.1 mitochondrial ornithine carrier protein [Coemansia thaxteri]KAJ2472227.1 mitochondrial ornithine carrier protein [Coemansia sp. RSA 2322]KAJ2488150.1 mitochondrial ornithine carrier protein [Coemansia sp. RSA 2320]